MKVYDIPGNPVAWARARRNGNRYYDPQIKQKEDMQLKVKMAVKEHISLIEPLKVDIEFHMPIPRSWSKIRRLKSVNEPHSSRPDLDNLVKFVNDTLNNILWKDDCLIYEIRARKIYSEDPKTRICLEKYEKNPGTNI